MKNFKLTIEYDGTNYFGWQRQKDNKRFPTVQGILENALQKLFNKKIRVIGSGRTDAGVHALGQVASFKIDTDIPPDNLLRAINSYLPEDIRIKKIEEVPLCFHPRFDAKKKWYRYTITSTPTVFNRYYAVYFPYKLDLALMRKAINRFKGYSISIKKNGEFIYIDIIGKGFLYKMVRRIVGVLVDAGRGKIVSGGTIMCQTAPARGLMLMKVYY